MHEKNYIQLFTLQWTNGNIRHTSPITFISCGFVHRVSIRLRVFFNQAEIQRSFRKYWTALLVHAQTVLHTDVLVDDSTSSSVIVFNIPVSILRLFVTTTPKMEWLRWLCRFCICLNVCRYTTKTFAIVIQRGGVIVPKLVEFFSYLILQSPNSCMRFTCTATFKTNFIT